MKEKNQVFAQQFFNALLIVAVIGLLGFLSVRFKTELDWTAGHRNTLSFEIDGTGTRLGVGGGIVADSRPDDEWAETELKAARLLALAATVPVREPQPA